MENNSFAKLVMAKADVTHLPNAGGAGNDTFVFAAGFGSDTVAAAANQDVIEFSTAVFANLPRSRA